jgi:DNA-directed RNA polymerase subunit RPC12/RpoP
MREYTCIDCAQEYGAITDTVKGPLPKRCPEHRRLRAYKLQGEYLERRKEQVKA